LSVDHLQSADVRGAANALSASFIYSDPEVGVVMRINGISRHLRTISLSDSNPARKRSKTLEPGHRRQGGLWCRGWRRCISISKMNSVIGGSHLDTPRFAMVLKLYGHSSPTAPSAQQSPYTKSKSPSNSSWLTLQRENKKRQNTWRNTHSAKFLLLCVFISQERRIEIEHPFVG
jgi:hypothetical protein